MKMPRWLVALLIVTNVSVALLVVGGWLVWPTITARRFVAAMDNGEFERANRLIVNGEWSFGNSSIEINFHDPGEGIQIGRGWGVSNLRRTKVEVTPEPVEVSDVLRGTRRLRLTRVDRFVDPPDRDVIWFEAGLGTVSVAKKQGRGTATTELDAADVVILH